MIRLLFQGDSITDGNRGKDASDPWYLNHQIGHSYAFEVAGTLGVKWPGKYFFLNRGVSGDTVEKIAARWQEDTLAEKPDILSLLLGINGNGNADGQYPEGVQEHLRQFEAGYRDLLVRARVQNPDLKIILMEPFVLPVGRSKTKYEAFMQVFRKKQAIIRQIATDFGAAFVPVQDRLEKMVQESANVLRENGWEGDPCAYWLWDGVHPTEPMHHVLAQWWLEAAEKIL